MSFERGCGSRGVGRATIRRVGTVMAAIATLSSGCSSSEEATAKSTMPAPSGVALASGAQPAFWLTGTCEGACFPALPDGLPQFTVYGDGTYVLANYNSPLTISSGTLTADEKADLEQLLASASISSDIASRVIPLPDGFYVSEPSTSYFSLRVNDRTITQGVASAGGPNPESAERQPYGDIVRWIGRLMSEVARQQPTPTERWVAIASTQVTDLGEVAWEQLDSRAWCTVFADAERTLELSDTGSWVLPAGVVELRPALPHESDCNNVEAWNALRSDT